VIRPGSGPVGDLPVRVDVRALEHLLGERVLGIDCRESMDRSTHALERALVELPGGRRLDLVLKGTRVPHVAGGFERPRLVRDDAREGWAYRSLLDPIRFGTPRFLGVLHAGTGRERLVLETVAGRSLAERGERRPWREAARWLGRFHEWGRARTLPAGAEDRLLRQSEALHFRWWRRALRRATAGGRTRAAERLRAIEAAYREAVVALSSTLTGLVHGEFYPSNILVERGSGGWRVRPVDWESIGVGPLLLDLAALTTGDWDDEERAAFYEAYEAAFVGGARGDRAAETRVVCPRGLAAARMVNAVQWLGWSSRWRAPSHHARDWLVEAEAAAADFAGPGAAMSRETRR